MSSDSSSPAPGESDLYAPFFQAAAHHHLPLQREARDVANRCRLHLVTMGVQDAASIDRALHEYAILETHFSEWRTRLESALQREPSRTTSWTTGVNQGMKDFEEQGGVSSVHTPEQMNFALRKGALVRIALEIREGVEVTVGGVMMLSRASNRSKRGAETRDVIQQELFPLYDDATFMRPEGDQTFPEKTSVTVRSMILPSLDEAETLGLVPEGAEMPDHLRHADLRRLGLPAAAKATLNLMIQKLKSEGSRYANTGYLLANIGELGYPDNVADRNINSLGASFNSWMKDVAPRTESIPLNPSNPQDLRLYFRIFYASLSSAIKALAGSDGIATGKGHTRQSLELQAGKFAASMKQAIDGGLHSPW